MKDNKLPIAKISRKHFIEWMYSDRDDYISIAQEVVNALIDNGDVSRLNISADKIFDSVGYINVDMIENFDEIESQLDTCEGFLSDEIESPSLHMKVEWT